jgi:AraC-like DNA-binding protein
MPKTETPLRHHRVSSKYGSSDYNILENGAVHFAMNWRIRGKIEFMEAFGPFWAFGFVRAGKGKVEYVVDGQAADCPFFKGGEWGVFYPPFSLARSFVQNTFLKSEGIFSTNPLPEEPPEVPVVFRVLPGVPFPRSANEVASYLKKASPRWPVPLSPSASVLSRKAKRKIDHGFTSMERLSDLAQQLGTSGAQLSRTFKKDYGLSPQAYRKHLRVTVAKLTLLRGTTSIVDAGLAAGFNDIGRLYKSLKETNSQTPGRYRPKS